MQHDSSLPRNASRGCLAKAGVTIADIDCIGWYEDPVAKLDRQLRMGLTQVPPAAPQFLFRLDAARPERELRELLGWEGQIEFVPYHLAHAASSYEFSGWRDAAIITVDAVGEWTMTSYGSGQDGNVSLFDEVRFLHSLGLFYSEITPYLGFDVSDTEYKVMALAHRNSFAGVESGAQLARTPLAELQFRLCPAHLVARFVGSPHDQYHEHGGKPEPVERRDVGEPRAADASMGISITTIPDY